MAIKIIIIPDNRVIEYQLKESKVKVLKVIEFLAKAEGSSLNAYVVMRKGEVITRDDELFDGEEIEVYRVASGG
ncbi:MAG: hypothetical protein DRO40_11285 [Thermoprotei archaeon]|nr:MAG: hypothetical protein DRO40_11285 [Thermoprotei archaeon]